MSQRDTKPSELRDQGIGLDGQDGDLVDQQQRQSGMALIIAILVVAIIFTFSTDLVISSRVNIENAIRHRDNVKAEYMAKSGINMAIFMLSLDFGIDMFLSSEKSPMKQPMSDSLGDMWAQLNGMPIGGATLQMITAMQQSFGLNEAIDREVMNVLKQFDGQFVLDVQDESSKININLCAKGTCTDVIAILLSLMSCPVEQNFLRDKNLEARELVYRIKDWVDVDSKAHPLSGTNDENDAYQRKDPPYFAKNAPFDSLSELRMVHGWDDELFTIFSPFLTIYPIQETAQDKMQINMNTVSRELLTCLFPNAAIECQEKFETTMRNRNEEKTALIPDGQSMENLMQEMFCQRPGDPTLQERMGFDDSLKSVDPSKWFATQSKVFKIRVEGEVGDQTQIVEVFVERVMPDLKKRQTRSYKIHEWRVL